MYQQDYETCRRFHVVERGFTSEFGWVPTYIGSSMPAVRAIFDQGFIKCFNISNGREGVYSEVRDRMTNAQAYCTYTHVPGWPPHLVVAPIWEVDVPTFANYWPKNMGSDAEKVFLHRTHGPQYVSHEKAMLRRHLLLHVLNIYDAPQRMGTFHVHRGTVNALAYAPKTD